MSEMLTVIKGAQFYMTKPADCTSMPDSLI